MLERLQKIIARAGIASRRHAEELIRAGQVRVNGVVVSELGAKADPERDRVEVAGKIAERPAQASYYVLNKPAHVVSTMSDPEGRATLRHLLRGLAGGVFPVGRLDYAASGLVLLTSDGALADQIFKHSARMPQVYWIKVKGRLSEETLREVRAQARAWLRLLRAPGAASPDSSNPWYEAEMSEARRDLLRNSLFALHHPVEKMRRVRFGPIELGDLPEAHYRSLAPSEVEQLRRAIARAEKAPRSPTPKRTKRFRREWVAKVASEQARPDTRQSRSMLAGAFSGQAANAGGAPQPGGALTRATASKGPAGGARGNVTGHKTESRTAPPPAGQKWTGQAPGKTAGKTGPPWRGRPVSGHVPPKRGPQGRKRR